ncbi:uracil-DNA glycosylase family protein [Hyphomicrobium sp.]|uniref:uracil-DNA glycosylase family protein n=1 Tax=Hyphomicrobium sp. TaxID=82 RepID=UPI0025C3ECC5|nr:uracil-DNA glycosylase family protein [Hyphomicrobium sp.]
MTRALDRLVSEIRSCRQCRAAPSGVPLPHQPRPVLRVSATARLAVVGQAPGTRVHASGVPFSDPSGVRLRAWMDVSDAEFYDETRIAIIPMGFCFPGLDAAGGDLPPRAECAPLWRPRLFGLLKQLELVLLVGMYAQRWHLGAECGATLGETVRDFRQILARHRRPRFLPLPHPSWRNNAWLKRNPWFETELLPVLRREVADLVRPG